MITNINAIVKKHSLPAQRFAVLKMKKQKRPRTQNPDKKLLVDVSCIIRSDARTGIQRVVRALLLQLVQNPPVGYQVVPVYCTRKHGYFYADNTFIEQYTQVQNKFPVGDVDVGNGDIFFGLDLAAHLIPNHEKQFSEWRQLGVKIHMLVYDLLPELHPEWFTSASVKNFRRWLRFIAIYADQLICISNTVKCEMDEWLKSKGFNARSPRRTTIPIGSDIKASMPSCGMDAATEALIDQLSGHKFLLMVGTIEPRKGYADVLDAMEILWGRQDDLILVIVGKRGWKTNALQSRIGNHFQLNQKLYWLENVSDQGLQHLFDITTGVLLASYGEGLGLPIYEALSHRRPLLVRNIPVFREVTAHHPNITYFDGNIAKLADSISDLIRKNILDTQSFSPRLATWEESALELKSCLGLQTVEGKFA